MLHKPQQAFKTGWQNGFLDFQLQSDHINNTEADFAENHYDNMSAYKTLNLLSDVNEIDTFVRGWKKGALDFQLNSTDRFLKLPDDIINFEINKYLPIKKGEFKNNQELVNLTIQEGVESIGEEAFASCFNLKSVSIPNSVKTIGSGAFASCFNLKSVSIPEGVISIGNNAFDYCENMESVRIPGTVEDIGDEAFIHCNSLKTVWLDEGIIRIGNRAFKDCNIEILRIPESVEDLGFDAFGRNANMVDAYIPTTLAKHLVVSSAENPSFGSIYSNYFNRSGSHTLKIRVPYGIATGEKSLKYERYGPHP